jgi:hypothetical protein
MSRLGRIQAFNVNVVETRIKKYQIEFRFFIDQIVFGRYLIFCSRIATVGNWLLMAEPVLS